MRRWRIGSVGAFTISIVLLAASCNSKQNPQSEAATQSSNEILAAGSTFVYPIMSRWISDFQQQHQSVHINYQSIGSGGGIQQLKKGLVSFAASDMALDDNQLKTMPSAVVQIPESAGPVCITYNLPDLKQPLKLSDTALSGIFLGTIKTWQDSAIRNDNPGVALPSTPIAVVHRSDGSGTTNIFTTYLTAVNPQWKKVGQGLAVNWPVGLGGKGSEGVTGLVKQTPGGIGYVELTYAVTNNLPVALVRNRAGEWVKPSAEGTTAAIAAFQKQLSQDVRTPIVDPPASARDAYPITGLTFLIIPADGSDKAKRQTIKQVTTYIITDGQSQAKELNYAPLPDSLKQIDLNLLSQIKADGQPL